MTIELHANLDRAAAFTAGLGARQLPPEVIDAAKKCLADWVGVAIGARDEAAGRAVRATVQRWRAQGIAPVLFGAATAPVGAALANGTLAHCLDFDDTHVGSVAHLSSPSWAAVLAAGSAGAFCTSGASGASAAAHASGAADELALLKAFVAAFEVGAQLGGQGFGGTVNHSGWHSTGVFGTLAAAAGAAAATGLDHEATGRALGIAATQAGGLTGSFGTMSKPFHAGKAAFNGVLSAEMASDGFVPALDLLEPDGALARALVQDRRQRLPEVDFDASWQLLANTFKPYACCLLAHATIDAGRSLRAASAGRAIAAITAFVNPMAIKLAAKPAPATALEGKFSTQYCAALALSGFAATQADFSPERIADPALQVLTGKVRLQADEAVAETASRMVIVYVDGTRDEAITVLARGNPGNPLTWHDLSEKFLPLVEPKLGARAAVELLECLRAFERPGALANLWRLCSEKA